MNPTFPLVEWKPQAEAGKRPLIVMSRGLPPVHQMPAELVHAVSFNRCLSSAAEHSGFDDAELAEKIHISPGYFSKFMRGVSQQWARRLVSYMKHTGSIAPLQWIAAQMGCEVVMRSSVEAELAQARARVAELEREGRAQP